MSICLSLCFMSVRQAQVQRSLDSSTSVHPRALIGRRVRKELSLGAGTESNGQGGSPLSEQDSGILDVEDDEEEEEEEVRRSTPKVVALCFPMQIIL